MKEDGQKLRPRKRFVCAKSQICLREKNSLQIYVPVTDGLGMRAVHFLFADMTHFRP